MGSFAIDSEAPEPIAAINALIRVELGIDPDTLSDEDWVQRYNEIVYVEQRKQQQLKGALISIINQIFAKE